MTESKPRKEFFSFHDEQSGFDKAINEYLRRLVEAQRDAVMSSDNVISYSHGESWLAFQRDENNEKRNFQEQSHKEVLNFEDIINHQISILPTFIQSMVEGIHAEFMKSVYQTIHEATDRTGNVVDAKEHDSLAEAFLEMLRTIEFGVTKDGEISRPELHMSPEMHEKFLQNIDAQGKEFKKKVKELTAEKEKTALERESVRKARFKKPPKQK